MPENPIVPVQVKREAFQHKGMDYDFLKEEGMRLVQLLSGQIWTDYNPHDPGVTILEQLCYALTDLGYRTDFKIQDLLNARSRQRRKEINNTFYDASEALPTNPVSIQDYRILLIDRVPYVRNAWIEVVRDNLQGINGLYRIILQIDEAARTPQNIERIKQEVMVVFSQHRNLCEDIDSIHVLGVERIVTHAELDISTEAIAEEVLANILFRLEEYLNPTIKFHTLDELQEEGQTVDEIFDGPVPVHGFIKKQDLIPVRREIYVSKLIEIISGVPGVRRINYFRAEKEGFPAEGDVIRIEDGFYPVLDLDPIDDKYAQVHRYPIKFYRGALNYEIDLNTVNQLYSALSARYRKAYQLEMLYHERDYPSSLKQEEIHNYYSIQNFFPITYGLNRFGLPSNVRPTRERVAMIKQLKGYLIFFEQLIANYLAQLGNVKELFSINEAVNKTYFSQIPIDIPGIENLLQSDGQKLQEKFNSFMPKLEGIVKEFDPFVDRRNRFLDHLMARFGEQFLTDFLLKVNIGDDTDPEHNLINAKIAFLRHWVEISRNRGKAFDYLAPVDLNDTWNVSGLEKRTCLLLNIRQRGNESLLRMFAAKTADAPQDAPLTFDERVELLAPDTKEGLLDLNKVEAAEHKRADEQLQQKKKDSKGTVDDQLNMLDNLLGDSGLTEQNNTNNTPPSPTKEDFISALPDEVETVDYTKRFRFRAANKADLLHDLLANALFTHQYVIIPNRKKTYSIYYKGNKTHGVYKVREADTHEEARRLLGEWITYLHHLNHGAEGMHVIEHILLRPQAKDKHGFRLINDQDKILLVSYTLGDLDDQKEIANVLHEYGGSKDQYKILEHPGEHYQIVLLDHSSQYVATCPEEFYSLEGAEDKVDDLVEHFQSFQDSRVPVQNFISFFMEQRKESNVGQQFYSLNMSMVMPNYPTRFQNTDFQTLLRSTVAVNAPVHLHINFYWLDYEQMTAFEQVYFDWLKERALAEPRQPDLDDKGHALIEFLKRCETQAQQAD